MNPTLKRLTEEITEFDRQLSQTADMKCDTPEEAEARSTELASLTAKIEERSKQIETERAVDAARAKVAAVKARVNDSGLVVPAARSAPAPKATAVSLPVKGYDTIEAADAAGRALVRLSRGEIRELAYESRAVVVAPSAHPIGVNNTLEPDSMGEASPLYDGRGSELVARDVYRGILNVIEYQSIARQLAMWIQVGTSGMYVPLGSDIVDADWYEENCEILGIRPNTTRATLDLKKMGARVQVSNELMDDAYVSVAQIVTNTIGNAFAHKLDKTLIQGDTKIGFGGIAAAVPAGQTVTSAAAGKPTIDEIASVMAKVDPMAKNRVWLVSEEGWSKVMGLATGSIGVNITQSITQTLFGAPIIRTSLLPAKTYAIYGDFSMACAIGYRSGLTIRSSWERAIEYDQTVFVGTARYAFAVQAAKYLAALKTA